MRYGLLLVALSLLAASGCSGSSTKPARRTIGLSVLTLTNPFFKEIADTMTEEAAKHGYDVLVVSGEFDVARQDNQVKDFLVKRVDAIVLCPCDSKAIGPVIQEANAAGVPVFTVDIACLAPEAKVVTHVATDNYAGGKQAGEAMIEALGETGGKVAILDLKTVESCQLRVKGFKEVIDAHNARRASARSTSSPSCPAAASRTRATRRPRTCCRPTPTWPASSPSTIRRRWARVPPWKKPARPNGSRSSASTASPKASRPSRTARSTPTRSSIPTASARQAARVIARYFEGDEVPAEMLIPTGLYRQADGIKDPALK